MGTITLTVEGTTVGTVAQGKGVSIRKTVSEQDSGRLIQAYAISYADKFYTETTDPETGAVTRTPRTPTIQEVLSAWWDGIVAGSLANVLSVEKAQAAQAAAANVAAITVS